MTNTKNKTTAKSTSTARDKNTPHDGLIKKVMENPIAAQEFLEEYLPTSFKERVDLSTVKVEKESFVEPNLKKQLSDIVLSVKTKDNKTAFVYTLIEAQVNSDYWIALRLWKYILLLCERHMKSKEKLPLVCPLVFYHGSKNYNAPMNLWELFASPEEAKGLLANDYQLVDLQAMSDDEINYDKHLSIILYMMKHINQRDKLKLIEDIFKNCHKAILLDQEQDYVYTKLMIWYNDCKIPLNKKQEFEQLVLDHLPKEKGAEIMKTIADSYIDEGVSKGILIGKNEGIAIGEARGEARGEAKGVEKIAQRMLKENTDIKFIASVTGFTIDEILKLQNKM
jgi:predicted transposase/invertase (TIGR01784 family)